MFSLFLPADLLSENNQQLKNFVWNLITPAGEQGGCRNLLEIQNSIWQIAGNGWLQNIFPQYLSFLTRRFFKKYQKPDSLENMATKRSFQNEIESTGKLYQFAFTPNPFRRLFQKNKLVGISMRASSKRLCLGKKVFFFKTGTYTCVTYPDLSLSQTVGRAGLDILESVSIQLAIARSASSSQKLPWLVDQAWGLHYQLMHSGYFALSFSARPIFLGPVIKIATEHFLCHKWRGFLHQQLP